MVIAEAGSAILRTALAGLSAPAAVAFAVLAVSARPWRGREAPAHPAGAALALPLAFAAAFVATHGWPRIAGAGLRDELVFAGLVVGLLEALCARRGGVPVLAQVAVAIALPLVLLDFQRERHWGPGEGALWSAALALLVFLAWSWLAARERVRARPGATCAWSLASALAAGAYQLSGSFQVAMLAGGLAAALGVCAAFGLWRHTSGLGAPGTGPALVLYLGLVWCGRFLSELSLAGFVLLSLAPLGLLVTRLVPGSRPRLATALELLFPVTLAGAALWLEHARSAPSPY